MASDACFNSRVESRLLLQMTYYIYSLEKCKKGMRYCLNYSRTRLRFCPPKINPDGFRLKATVSFTKKFFFKLDYRGVLVTSQEKRLFFCAARYEN